MPQDVLAQLGPLEPAIVATSEPEAEPRGLAAYATPSAQIQAVLRWALANPFGTSAECASHFRIQKGTASRILNCDAFKVAYAAALREHDAEVGGHSLNDKVTGALAQGVELLSEQLPGASPKFLLGAVGVLAKLHETINPPAGGQATGVQLTINNQVVAVQGARTEMLNRARSAGPYPAGRSERDQPPLSQLAYPERAED